MKKKTRRLLILNGLLILIVAAAILSVNSGYARIPFSAAVRSILQPHTDGASVVVAQFRVPRIVLAVLCVQFSRIRLLTKRIVQHLSFVYTNICPWNYQRVIRIYHV